ncbi:AAA family ATPase [Paracholeplasma manati]|uniref:AAA family ATPase n=1 Tax=Paracholeplasma manati TaxID=591373 RepID=UPI002408421B|nr:AAA family ATPase [Paracholeplasma manati]MDG0888612.1 AAA family ATPase [Paracholeplasma manati]
MPKIKQQAILDQFKRAIAKDRLSHLYLFTGPKGSGKKELAFEIANALLLNKTDGAELLKTNGHVNLMFIEPAGQNIKKEQIADLQSEFSKTSLTKGARVYIIDEVDKLSTAAANGLLKFLEEPLSKQTVGFLLSDNPELVLPTIQSRSQIIFLKPRSEHELTLELKEAGVDPYLAEFLPYLNKDRAIVMEMAKKDDVIELINCVKNYHKTLLKKEPLWLLFETKMSIIRSDKTVLIQFLELIMIYYLDLLKTKNQEIIAFDVFSEEYETIAGMLTMEDILKHLKQIQTLLYRLNYNINIEMALTQLVLDLES